MSDDSTDTRTPVPRALRRWAVGAGWSAPPPLPFEVGDLRLSEQEMLDRQVEILRAVAAFCDRHELRYFLCGGTLLGSVRHRGYIPWDDDIDIMLPRRDYTRFLELFDEGEVGHRLLSTSTDARYRFPFAKVADQTTVVIGFSKLSVDMGVHIDVFPVDSLPSSAAARRIERFLLWALDKVLAVKNFQTYNIVRTRKRLLHMVLRVLLAPVPARSAAVALDAVARAGSRMPGKAMAGVQVWAGWEEVPAEAYASASEGEFEGDTYAVPVDSHAVLRAIYGDYMQLPPPELRIPSHGLRAFRRFPD